MYSKVKMQNSKLQFKIPACAKAPTPAKDSADKSAGKQSDTIVKILYFASSFFILIFAFYALPQVVRASETNGAIVTGGNAGYTWSNQAGWVNFGATNSNIQISDSGITGYAWNASYGWINMNPSNGGVKVAANGALSGYAWSSGLGWVNFSGVSINSSGKFTGNATGTNIGTLTFDCTNCDVRTDFRPANFRTTQTTQTQSQTVSGGGGGGGGGIFSPTVSGPGGQPVPAHMNAYNVPLKLYPAQSGTLTQNLSNQKQVVLEIPSNVSNAELTFNIREEIITSTIVPTIRVIGNGIFEITARDNAGNFVHTLLKPIKITFNVPEQLRGRSDLGVYFFDEERRAWVKIPDAIFSDDSVSFSVDHLTFFAIFAGPELPLVTVPSFQLPIPFEFEIPRPEIETPAGGEEIPAGGVPGEAEEISEENSPLFDIEVSPGPSESNKARVFIILAIVLIAAAGVAFYVFRRMKKNKQ